MNQILRTSLCSLSVIAIAAACAPQQRKANPRGPLAPMTTANGTVANSPNILSAMKPLSNGVIAAKAELPLPNQTTGTVKFEVKNGSNSSSPSIVTANIDSNGNVTVGSNKAGVIKCSDTTVTTLGACANAAGTVTVGDQEFSIRITRKTDLPMGYEVLKPDASGKYNTNNVTPVSLGTASDVTTTISDAKSKSTTEEVVIRAAGNTSSNPDISDVKLDRSQNALVKVVIYGLPNKDEDGNTLSAPQPNSFDPSLSLTTESSLSYNYQASVNNGKTLERVVIMVDKTPDTFDPAKLGGQSSVATTMNTAKPQTTTSVQTAPVTVQTAPVTVTAQVDSSATGTKKTVAGQAPVSNSQQGTAVTKDQKQAATTTTSSSKTSSDVTGAASSTTKSNVKSSDKKNDDSGSADTDNTNNDTNNDD